ncbi:hypothetical protein IWQ51_002683 [Labrenzia sp. EL_142]|nr:hypothetical protein [Labrenzia sp. EL_142]
MWELLLVPVHAPGSEWGLDRREKVRGFWSGGRIFPVPEQGLLSSALQPEFKSVTESGDSCSFLEGKSRGPLKDPQGFIRRQGLEASTVWDEFDRHLADQ